MRHLIVAHIERIVERYSDQWFRWLKRDLQGSNDSYCFVGKTGRQKIRTGQFLDVYGTNEFKAAQAVGLVRVLQKPLAEGPKTILFLDGWNPVVEMMAYIRSCADIDVRLVGVFHAGSYDPHDFLFQKGCRIWAGTIEREWIDRIYDRVLVATEYHRQLLINAGVQRAEKIKIVQFPVYQNKWLRRLKKEQAVVFPHRLAPEKQPEFFMQIKDIYERKYGNDAVWIKTYDLARTKQHYYQILARCKVSFSAALQETFGIAMLESESLGCIPVAPNRLSYPETLKPWPRYENENEAVEMIRKGLLDYRLPSMRHTTSMAGILEGAK